MAEKEEFICRSEYQRTLFHCIEPEYIIIYYSIDFLLIKEVKNLF